MDYIEEAVAYILPHLVSLMFTLVKGGLVLFIGLRIGKWIVKLIKKSRGFSRLDDGVQTFLISIIDILIKIVVVVTAITILGINLSAAVTALASCGLTLGLAFQGALSNFAGGFIILVFRPFKVGDFIDTHVDMGTVEAISIFHTKLRTPDNKLISVPNGSLSNSSVINYSALPVRRVDFEFRVAYDSDIKKVKEILAEIGTNMPTRMADRPCECMLGSFGESHINVLMRIWVKSSDYWPTKFEVNELVKAAFEENGIIIPFPQIDVHSK